MKPYLIKYTKYLLNIAIWALTAFLLVRFAPTVLAIFLPFILGWLVATIANPLVKFLESKLKLKRKVGSILIIVGVLSLMVMLVYMGIAKLVTEAAGFVNQLPDMSLMLTADFNTVTETLKSLFETVPPDIRNTIFSISGDAVAMLSGMLENAGRALVETTGALAKNIPSLFIAFIITIISSYFMLVQKEEIAVLVRRNVSGSSRRMFEIYSSGISKILGGYFKAQFKLLGIIFIIIFAGFMILRIDYALLFSVLIALLDFLPFFGTGTVLGPWAVFAALSGDYQLAVGLIIIYVITQLSRRVLEPKILGDTIGMDPLLTLVLMYVGFRLFGVWGLIFSAPAGMLAMNLYSKGVFDNPIFILKDIRSDIKKLRNIESYKVESRK